MALPEFAATKHTVITEEAVVLAQREKTYRLFRFRKGKKLNFDKVSFFPGGALGCPYGSSFEVDNKQLLLVSKKAELADKLKGDSLSAPDNRGVFDDGAAQELTEEDVVAMKGQGVKGQAIVESMVEHSSSFKEKTKFSQEKYIRKKEKKHNPVFRIVRPSTRLLCAMYRDIAPSKICHLREDTLSRILTMSNIQAHSNVIVMETCQGFLTGALLERMGGLGNLVQMFFGDFPVRTILDNFGHLSETDLSILKMYPLHRVGALLTAQEQSTSTVLSETLTKLREEPSKTRPVESLKKADQPLSESGASPSKELMCEKPETKIQDREMVTDVGEGAREGEQKEVRSEEDLLNEPAVKRPKLDDQSEHSKGGKEDRKGFNSSSSKDKEHKRQQKEEAYKQAAELLSQKSMDGLVIVSRFHPEPILMTLIHLLAPSRTIVVYYHILEPLVQCYKNLKESGLAFNIQISETWMRHYQVLEDRTHPLMNMSGHSGYLLTATTIKQNP